MPARVCRVASASYCRTRVDTHVPCVLHSQPAKLTNVRPPWPIALAMVELTIKVPIYPIPIYHGALHQKGAVELVGLGLVRVGLLVNQLVANWAVSAG